MAISKIDVLMENFSEDYMRNVFVDRLENARMAVDDPMLGDSAENSKALGDFMSLTPQERITEIERLRILATVINWANDATVPDINSIITALRNERDKIIQQSQEPVTDPGEEETEEIPE